MSGTTGASRVAAESGRTWAPAGALACSAAIAAINITLRDRLWEAAAQKGEYIMNRLCDIASQYPQVYKDLTGIGLVIGQPFQVAGVTGEFDVMATVKGGGLSGQAGAVKHGISQALSKFEPLLRQTIKAAGFLTRDSRVVERKKYGRAKARKSFQFSKR